MAENRLSVAWATLAVVALAIAATAFPGIAVALEHDRSAMLHGELWRPVTGQLVHWSWPMAGADLGVIAVAGSLVERRSRRRALLGIGAALLAVAGAVALSPDLLRYRGSSGVATALVALALMDVVLEKTGARALALGGLVLLLAKVTIELATGRPLLAWTMPPGIELFAPAHAAGLLAGVAVAATARAAPSPPRGAGS